MNYFRTELMRYFMHNYTKLTKIQKTAILSEIPFNTHFNWNFNLVTVLSCIGNKSDAIKGLLQFGVPYISQENGNTPLYHAVEMHDRQVINVFVNHFAEKGIQLSIYDTQHIIKDFNSTWKNNFIFEPAKFTIGAYKLVENEF